MRTLPATSFDPITLALATWLACGAVLLGMTPLPLHSALTGWAPAFWLLAAPALLLLARPLLAPRATAATLQRASRRGELTLARPVRRRPRAAIRRRPQQPRRSA